MKRLPLLVLLAFLLSPSTLLSAELPIWKRAVPVDPDVAEATRAYAKSGQAPVLHAGSVRRYPYGLKSPILRCAPLRVCAIVLEDGEHVVDILAGDTAQWLTFQSATGAGGNTPVIGVKPILEPGRTCDRSTNLIITTDRRIYQVLLDLPACSREETLNENPNRPFDGIISFYYPQETLRRWERQELERTAFEERVETSQVPLTPAIAVENLHWDYTFRRKGPRFPWNPTAVFDDGERTYVRLPPGLTQAPVPFAISESGELSLLNHRFDGELLVLDRVVERFVLTLPGPKKKLRKLIVRRNGEAPR